MNEPSLGTWLVRRGVLSMEDVGAAKAAVLGTRATWLERLVLTGTIDGEAIVGPLSAELRVPRCDPQVLANVPSSVIARLPSEVACEHRMVPVGVDGEGYLHVAMEDPSDEMALDEAGFFAGCGALQRQVASAAAIGWALHRYYGFETPLWRALL
jgi:hypothetical protein